MVKFYRKWFNLSDIWISSNEKYSDFYLSSWQPGDSALPMLVVRLLLSGISIGILAWAVYEGPNPYWLMFFTNWGLVLVNVMLLNGVLVSFMAVFKKFAEGVGGELPWYMTTYWFFYNVSVTIALTITSLYWILLFNPESSLYDKRLFYLDVATHGVNSCIAMAELILSRMPTRLAHVYQPLGVGLWYAGFTALYYIAGGTDGDGNPYIYEILDWRHGRRSTMIVGSSMVGLVLLYLMLCGIALIRDKASTYFFRSSSVNLPYTPPDPHMLDYTA